MTSAGFRPHPPPRQRELERPLRTRMVRPRHHDTYAQREKPADAVLCRSCGLVCHGGRWTRGAPPLVDVREGLCPACERMRDRYPAGTIRLPAAFLPHADEVRALVARVEETESAEHPLERVMAVQVGPDGIVVTTTGIHVARRATERLRRRFHARPTLRHAEEGRLLYVDFEG